MAARRARGPRTQLERSETTQAALRDRARACFAELGYEATNLDEVARRAGVTKGALYHHFAGKRELFEAVFEEEQSRLAQVGLHAYGTKADPWVGLHEACRAFLEASLDPGVRRITLLDGPGVLGWERMREIENRYSVANLRSGLELAMASGIIAKRPLDPLVPMLHGAICEGAMFVARSAAPRAATRQVLAELRVLLDVLVTPRRA